MNCIPFLLQNQQFHEIVFMFQMEKIMAIGYHMSSWIDQVLT